MRSTGVALITGAARGLGAELARSLARRGYRLALVGLEPDLLAANAGDLGPEHRWFVADVRDQEALARAVADTRRELGGIDVCVANAGISNLGTVTAGDPDAWATCVEVNLVGTLRTAHAVMPALIERRGYLLVVCSLASFAATHGLSAYCASKAGAEQLAISLRREVSFRGVAVGTAHPAWVATDLVRDAEIDLQSFKAMRAALPWPANRTLTASTCAEAFTHGIERRARRICVPRSLALINWMRTVLNGPIGDYAAQRQARTLIPQLEDEIRDLGRGFSSRNEKLTKR